MNNRVIFSPEAQVQLAEPFRYIAEAASPRIAMRYTEAIVSYASACAGSPFAAPDEMTCALARVQPTTRNGQ